MLSLLKMDIYRLFHRKMLYVLIAALSSITLSMLVLSEPSGMTFAGILGVLDGVSMENFMRAASGLGLVYTLMSILLSFFVCDDFSSGFAKNIFTVHANKRDYIVSKIMSMMAASGVLMLVSLLESVIFAVTSGIALGSMGGIIWFWIEKWVLSAAFAAAILFISILFRNKGLGFLSACLLGTGGLVMGVAWAFETLRVPYAGEVLSWTIYGSSTVPTMSADVSHLLHILLATVVWSVFYSILSAAFLKRKDI